MLLVFSAPSAFSQRRPDSISRLGECLGRSDWSCLAEIRKDLESRNDINLVEFFETLAQKTTCSTSFSDLILKNVFGGALESRIQVGSPWPIGATRFLFSCLRDPASAERSNAWVFVVEHFGSEKNQKRLSSSDWKELHTLCLRQKNPNCLLLLEVSSFRKVISGADSHKGLLDFLRIFDPAQKDYRKGYFTSIEAGGAACRLSQKPFDSWSEFSRAFHSGYLFECAKREKDPGILHRLQRRLVTIAANPQSSPEEMWTLLESVRAFPQTQTEEIRTAIDLCLQQKNDPRRSQCRTIQQEFR